MQGELKPCPFCGGRLGVENEGHKDDCYILMLLCRRGEPHEVDAAWNRRATDGQRAGVPEGEHEQTFVLLSRPGMCVVQKGPFRDRQMIEEMVRGLYDLYPDATCIVADMPYNGSANDGREWVAMYGDRRRKKLAAAPLPSEKQVEPESPMKVAADALRRKAELEQAHQDGYRDGFKAAQAMLDKAGAVTEETALETALKIMANLEDRNGVLDGVDDDTKADIADEIALAILAASRKGEA